MNRIQGQIRNKLVLLGAPDVGKSALVRRFVSGKFDDCQVMTMGAAYLHRTLLLEDLTVMFDIWDTAGSERFKSLAPLYYRGAQAAVVVYDISDPASFERAQSWVSELRQRTSPYHKIVIALAGNKADLAHRRLVEYSEAKYYADENGLLFMETSAKTAQNVNEIFVAIAKKLPEYEVKETEERNEVLRLHMDQMKKKKRTFPKNCCK